MTKRSECRDGFSNKKRDRLRAQTSGVARYKWEMGLSEATFKINELQRKGWIIDENEGALTGEEADRVSKDLETQGFQTKRIKVVSLENDEIQFVAYKATSKKTRKASSSTSTTSKSFTTPRKEATVHRCFRCRESLPKTVFQGFETTENAKSDHWLLNEGWLELFVDPILTDDDDATFVYVCPNCLKIMRAFLNDT